MKALSLIGFALVPAAFVLGTFIDAERPSQAAQEPAALAPEPERAAPNRVAALSRTVERLVQRIDSLEAEVESQRARAERRAVEPTSETVAPLAATPTAPTRDQIARVVEDLDQQKRLEREAQREQKIVDATVGRATKVARFASLDPASEKVLADLMLTERDRYGQLRTELADLPKKQRKEALRIGMEDMRAWRSEQLATHFDANTAENLKVLLERKGKAAQDARTNKRGKPGGKNEKKDRSPRK
ncbi:MAG: hypothetical protein GY711_27625 [bacterium]|nr:hypothetical protein [bacterium]